MRMLAVLVASMVAPMALADEFSSDFHPGGSGGGYGRYVQVQCTAAQEGRGWGRTYTAIGRGRNDGEAFRDAQARAMEQCRMASGGRGPYFREHDSDSNFDHDDRDSRGGRGDGRGDRNDDRGGGWGDGRGDHDRPGGGWGGGHGGGWGGGGSRNRCVIVSCRPVSGPGGGWGGNGGGWGREGSREVVE